MASKFFIDGDRRDACPTLGVVSAWSQFYCEYAVETAAKPWFIIAVCRQTAAFLWKIELSVPHCGMPKAATPVLQRSDL
jgi:hypothetical protein